jgi:hypothetical protein
MFSKKLIDVFANMKAAECFYMRLGDPKEIVMQHAEKVIELFPASSDEARYAKYLLAHFMCL